MQVKLLRVLQERVFERVGSCLPQRCDVRIIAATHCDLEQAIIDGTFRADLFYRLNVVPIDMPPLRERGEDLPLLIAALAERIQACGRPRVQFSIPALEALKAYRWPGNVRELGNLIERLSIQCQSRAVGVADLPARYRPDGWTAGSQPTCEALVAVTPAVSVLAPAMAALELNSQVTAIKADLPDGDGIELDPDANSEGDTQVGMAPQFADALLETIPSGFDLRHYLETLEQRLIAQAMESSGGTVAQAARVLGLRRTTLVEKLRKYSMVGSEAVVPES
jgi:sigma-54 specific flagellar transcriptional regulator A